LQTIGEDFCGLDVNTPLGGGEPVIERPVCTMNNVLLTAVAATSTGDFTVVFLGTSKGHLKKVFIISIIFHYTTSMGKCKPLFLFYLFDSNVNCETFF
jgi:plexin A